MKTFTVLAALAAVITVSAPAFAQNTTAPAEAGHWEWRSQPSHGPRAPLRAPVRFWVPANAATVSKEAKPANCDCAILRHDARLDGEGRRVHRDGQDGELTLLFSRRCHGAEHGTELSADPPRRYPASPTGPGFSVAHAQASTFAARFPLERQNG